MTENSGYQALQKVSAEIDESKVKIIISTQCIKAQEFLIDTLRKQSQHSKETCDIIKSANANLQFEITQAQQQINSMLSAQETIRSANVEIRKELLLTKESKIRLKERGKNGEKKYEDLWLKCKAQFESLHFVKKLLKANAEVANLTNQMTKLQDEKNILIKKIEVEKQKCLAKDRERIIELADFMVKEMPKCINLIKQKTRAINELSLELEKLDSGAKAEGLTLTKETKVGLKTDTGMITAENNNDRALIMPKLQLDNPKYDAMNVKLDQVCASPKPTKLSGVFPCRKELTWHLCQMQIIREDTFNKTPERNIIISITLKDINANKKDSKKQSTEEYISSFFVKPSVEEHKPQDYAKMKLINILEDINIDKNDAEKIMANVNPARLHPVDMISVYDKNTNATDGFLKSKDKKPLECDEDIEMLDITGTGSNADNSLILPPSQFLDMVYEEQVPQVFSKEQEQQQEEYLPASTSTEILNVPQAQKNSQEGHIKKKVSFNFCNPLENNKVSDAEQPVLADEIDANEALNSQLNASTISDEGAAQMKDMLMKKQNLDLSPQFVYAKNIMTPLNLHSSDDAAVITSKFFKHNQSKAESKSVEHVTIDDVSEAYDIAAHPNEAVETEKSPKNNKSPIVEMDVNVDVTSPKRQKMNEIIHNDKHASGAPFNNGSQMIADSFNISMNTAEYEDCDVDFPHCIDSSLLLSPKADTPMPVSVEGQGVSSQDVPNFLSGIRKSGLKLFGTLPWSEPKAESSAQGGSSFNFNFGGEEKKSRGGFFNLFQ